MGTIKKSIAVTGMSCASCAISVEKVLKAQPGIVDAGVNFANTTARVAYDDDQISLPQLKQAVQSAGYDLIIEDDNNSSLD